MSPPGPESPRLSKLSVSLHIRVSPYLLHTVGIKKNFFFFYVDPPPESLIEIAQRGILESVNSNVQVFVF